MLDTKTTPVVSLDQRPEPFAARVLEIEISQPLPILSAFDEKTEQYYHRAFCMIRLHTRPLGMVEIQFSDEKALPQHYAQHIWQQFKDQIIEHLQKDNLPLPIQLDADGLPCVDTPVCLKERAQFLTHAPFVSVIVATRDRPECLADCLSALVKLQYPHYEILIVDNAPTTTASADLVQQFHRDDPRVRYLSTDRPGTSLARNLGMMEAKGDIVAFTDDDAVVDAHWLTELVRAFSHAENVVCVAGSIGPLRLDTFAQLWLETYFRGLGDSKLTKNIFSTHRIDRESYYKHLFMSQGASVNMATTATFLRAIGGFDPALGPGTPVHAAEDLEVFFQSSMHGGTYVYEPAALVYHLNRQDLSSLEKQIHYYGISLPCLLILCVLRYPRIGIDLVRRIVYKLTSFLYKRLFVRKQKEQVPDTRRKWGELIGSPGEKAITIHLMRQLFRGWCKGPFALVKSVILLGNRRDI